MKFSDIFIDDSLSFLLKHEKYFCLANFAMIRIVFKFSISWSYQCNDELMKAKLTFVVG